MEWLHNAAGVPLPAANPFVTLVLEGLRRTLAKLVNKKAPIDMEIPSAMVEDNMENWTLTNVRQTSAYLLAYNYAGFLCFNKLHKL